MNGAFSGDPLEQSVVLSNVNINIPNECFIFEWRIFIFAETDTSLVKRRVELAKIEDQSSLELLERDGESE